MGKKVFAFCLILLLSVMASACSQTTGQEKTPETPASETEDRKTDLVYELALVTGLGELEDQAFHQYSYTGLKRYAEEQGIPYKYYRSAEETTDGLLAAIDLAVKGGAKLVVVPGSPFEAAVYQAQDLYPDVKFLCLDFQPQSEAFEVRQEDNVYCVLYAEEQGGFLAGYALVKEGFRELGFLGGIPVPAVVRFGYGFVQGAEEAARELGLGAGEVNIKYACTGNFEATEENQALAARWYGDGTEVIFGCGGAVNLSVMAAAEEAGKFMVGVDADQSQLSETVITSCMKGLADSVYNGAALFYEGKFPGGQTVTLTAAEKGIWLPMESSRFEHFLQEDYDRIFQRLAEDREGLASSILKDRDAASVTELGLERVRVETEE